jgi:hypothetical protein
MKLAGENFEVTRLVPFGERWTPEKGPLVVEKWIKRDIGAVIEKVKAAGVAVIDSTRIARDWGFVPEGRENHVPHVDSSGFAEPIAVQMLHADGPRGPTSYAKNAGLVEAAKDHLADLKAAHAAASEDTRTRFGLNSTLEQYTRPGQEYYSASPLESLPRIRDELFKLYQQRTGSLWVAGQDPAEVRREWDELTVVYGHLSRFYENIARYTAKFVHPWTDQAATTVLSYQNEIDRFFDPESVVYHFSDPDGAIEHPTPLKRNAILGEFGRNSQHVLYTDAMKAFR